MPKDNYNEMKQIGETVPATSENIRTVKRSEVTELSKKTHSFYWGSPCVPDPKHLERKKLETFVLPFMQSVLKMCGQRNDTCS